MTQTPGTPVRLTRRREIEWSECDPAGIVYYPRYAEMFDANTNALFHHVTGLSKRQIQATHDIVGWPMVDSQVSFRAPATYGDVVEITSHVARFGGSSIELHHRIAHLDGTVIAEGTDKRVWVGRHPDKPGAIKAQPLPQAFTVGFFTAE
ncbi:acyl-CoA thioesterase [Pseudooceanicola sp. 200-1SW]|uniref:acyl-CoA thioesterase n=1 Tax=Pseudooceanicola sp. 200-1SW TaxID=3425949 RepID=UPI003D7F6F48